jgi:thiol:disulfide interchange protein DsbD
MRPLLIMATAALLCGRFFGQAPEDIVSWSAHAPAAVTAGAHIEMQLHGRIQDGWHIYSISQPPGGPTTTYIELTGKMFHQDGVIKGPAPHRDFDPNFSMETETHEGDVTYAVPAKADPAAAPGAQKIEVDVTFQSCNETMCLPPHTTHVQTPIKISGPAAGVAPPATAATLPAAPERSIAPVASPPAAPAAAVPTAAAAAATSTVPSSDVAALRSRSLGSFLWLALGMGALSLLTPCVFPMVPITVSYFSNHGSKTRQGALAYAGVYGLGVVLTFSAIGLALALIFGAAGVNQLAANPWVNLFITALFLAFAFSLFGAYFIQVPASWMNRINRVTRSSEGSHALGALLMGFTFSLTSFTCTAPFVGTLLVMAAQGSWRWPLLGMIAYSTVFAMPFVGLALAPQLLSRLPRSGNWMNQVKVVMGFLEIAAAMKFLSNADLVWGWGIFTRTTVLAVWIACGAAVVLYVYGLFRLNHDQPVAHIGAPRLAIGLLLLAMTVALIPGLLGKPLGELDSFLPPAQAEAGPAARVSASPSSEVQWMLNDYPGGLQKAQQEKRPILIDFTGYTCTNCRWMEANMFPRPAVKAELEKFVTVRLYTDGHGALYENQQKLELEHFGTVALPLYAILRPDGSAVKTFPGLTRDADQFLAFLHSGDSALATHP